MPASAITSASPSFCTVMPTAPSSMARLAKRGSLWVLIWGRSFRPWLVGIGLRALEIGLDAIEVDQHGGRIEFGDIGHLPLRTSSTKRRLPAVSPASTGSTVPVMPEAASEQ